MPGGLDAWHADCWEFARLQRAPVIAAARRRAGAVNDLSAYLIALRRDPGRAEALFQLRDADPAVLDKLHAELNDLIAAANRVSRCKFELTVISQSTPAVMDERLMAALDTAAERHAPGKHMRMPSGAGHDAQWLARKLPAAMMFVPSIGGISHHWSENTADEDLVLGAQVFADGIAEALKT